MPPSVENPVANTDTLRMQPVKHLNKINSCTYERINWLLLSVNRRHVNELIHTQVLSLPVLDNIFRILSFEFLLYDKEFMYPRIEIKIILVISIWHNSCFLVYWIHKKICSVTYYTATSLHNFLGLSS